MEQTKLRALLIEANEDEAAYMSQHLENYLTIRAVPDTLEKLDAQDLSDVEVLIPFIHSRIDRSMLEAMPQLKIIATRSTGYDHIDVAAAHERNVLIANVPGYGETAVAEFTFALLLSLSRKVHLAAPRTRVGDYTLEGLRGFDLYGKTIGVIGAGAIGLRVVRIATGFGMHVLVFDEIQRKRNRLLAEVLGFNYVLLDELLARSDVVTLHAPALPSTHHMLNRDTLAKMKRGSYLINTARGSLVDTRALAWALDEHILAGVALDALEGEEFIEREEELLNQPGNEEKLRLLVNNNMLQRRPNVIITPHIAFNSAEALRRIQDTTIENIQCFIAGDPQNLIQ